MIFVGTTQGSTDTLHQFAGGEQTGRLDDLALGVDCVRLERIEPGALALRTVWSSPPRLRAMTRTISPRAEASRIGQRRSTTASDERRPATSSPGSSALSARTQIGRFRPNVHCISEPPICTCTSAEK